MRVLSRNVENLNGVNKVHWKWLWVPRSVNIANSYRNEKRIKK